MRKLITLTILISLANFSVIAQNVSIPDANFKAYLVGNTSINTNADSEIQVSEANSFTGVIIAASMGITDLTGVEAFTNIQGLIVNNNSLDSIDVSAISTLLFLNCQANNLDTIDVSQNTALTSLIVSDNNINSIDVSQNTALSTFNCWGNNLDSLDVSQNVNLSSFDCALNNLTELNLSTNTSLVVLTCSSNNLTQLDLSNNTSLSMVQCGINSIESLDLSQNTQLTSFIAQSNNLTQLNLKNLDPATLTSYNTTSNPNLTCIEVDDVASATANWTNIDPASSFSLSCFTPVNAITVQGQGGASTITTDGGTLQMEATVQPTNASDQTITWSVTNGTGSATIDANGILTAQTNGIVTVVATANDGSSITGSANITISNQIAVGVNEISEQNLMIYPNPTQSSFTIKTPEVIQNIFIVDVVGKSYSIPVNSEKVVDLTNFKTGVYFVVIETPNGNITKRITKL
ncbi:MAG: Ig-like domain-containing protein [Putridiphycobacter sp.]